MALMRTTPRAQGRLPHVWMRRRGRGNPDRYAPLAAGGALHRPAPVDEAPVAPEVARQPVEVDVAHVRPPGPQAPRARHERTHAMVDEPAECVDYGRVSGLAHCDALTVPVLM